MPEVVLHVPHFLVVHLGQRVQPFQQLLHGKHAVAIFVQRYEGLPAQTDLLLWQKAGDHLQGSPFELVQAAEAAKVLQDAHLYGQGVCALLHLLLHPGTINRILRLYPARSAHADHLADQVQAILGNVHPQGGLEDDVALADLGSSLRVSLPQEWHLAAEQEVQRYTGTPDIAALAIVLVQHLRGHVGQGAHPLVQNLALAAVA
mmetsp:Transcript_90248/g.232970  ORF Transcript_90248/g.232970 Transcript_90248/m.232970 type:complete len:204 (+) Transcript_90248:640-1251(+)